MSKLTSVAIVFALGAAGLGGAAYQKAASVQTEVRALSLANASRTDPVEGPSVEALERDLNRMAARVAVLELRARSATMPPVEATAAAPADSAVPAEKERRSRSPYDVGPIPKDAEQREARKQMVDAAVAAHWKAWAAKHGLTDRQAADLSSLQRDAAKRRLDNQARLADGQATQPETRAANQALAEEVRGKAKALLTAEQFAQFEADKGAEFGASLRKIREAEASEASSVPASGN